MDGGGEGVVALFCPRTLCNGAVFAHHPCTFDSCMVDTCGVPLLGSGVAGGGQPCCVVAPRNHVSLAAGLSLWGPLFRCAQAMALSVIMQRLGQRLGDGGPSGGEPSGAGAPKALIDALPTRLFNAKGSSGAGGGGSASVLDAEG
jgi:hypothetical protein